MNVIDDLRLEEKELGRVMGNLGVEIKRNFKKIRRDEQKISDIVD